MERSRNIVKGLASVVQLVFSSITLYRARGSQLQRYGYAAFGLSVFPYTLMTFVNLVVFTIVGEYSALFVLRTAISDEAKRCSGTISGEIGTLPEATQSVDTVESPVEEDRNLNGGIGAGGIGEDGSGVPLMPEMSLDYPRYQHYSAAYLRVEDDGVLVITMKGRTGRFKLIEGDDDDPLTFHFHVSALTNQEKAPKREKPQKSVSLIFFFFNLILIILLYVFISLLSGFRKRDSTSAQRGWIISWLVFNQVFSVYGLMFTFPDIGGPVQGVVLAVTILVLSIPAIGGFVMVGRMLLEFGTCSVL